jgi:acyl-CoA thioesterase FadM
MPRIKINLPEHFSFSTQLPIRITDLNYGGHVGNDSILSLLHEIRMQYLQSMGYTELQFAGVGLIMSDVSIEFKAEAFYGDIIKAEVDVTEISKVAFDIVYKLSKTQDQQDKIIALAKTGMVCYNYKLKKVVAIPEEVKVKLQH